MRANGERVMRVSAIRAFCVAGAFAYAASAACAYAAAPSTALDVTSYSTAVDGAEGRARLAAEFDLETCWRTASA
ncbi:MAG: hypothetical protein WDM89_05610 [Rhizomicrobium sp.]